MNIQEAKEQIKRAVSIYLMKDEYGAYRIPVERQRPVFMIGAPGIGKTAVMEQIASELGINLVSYSMSHHTRQSALGLPFIVHKNYDGHECDVTEYTMSEIIASVYDTMEKSGIPEGILFLDEINCVSETLSPSMLQFLQYKTFGNHKVPEGWAIVTAGNPIEYNSAVRMFDVATLDRLKVLMVEPDYEAWRLYGSANSLHRSILTFLDIKKDDFYLVDSEGEDKQYVTARGWEDLSEAISLYEEQGYPVDESLIVQYIRSGRIAREFATYYALFSKYKNDYKVADILEGKESEEVRSRAKDAGFDEKLTLTGLIMDAAQNELKKQVRLENNIKKLLPHLKNLKTMLHDTLNDGMEISIEERNEMVRTLLQAEKDAMDETWKEKKAQGAIDREERHAYHYLVRFIRKCWDQMDLKQDEDAFGLIGELYQKEVDTMKDGVEPLKEKLENLFTFAEKVFGEENEMLLIVTNLTVNKLSAEFIAEHGCDGYFRHNKRLMMYERNKEIQEAIRLLDQELREGRTE